MDPILISDLLDNFVVLIGVGPLKRNDAGNFDMKPETILSLSLSLLRAWNDHRMLKRAPAPSSLLIPLHVLSPHFQRSKSYIETLRQIECIFLLTTIQRVFVIPTTTTRLFEFIWIRLLEIRFCSKVEQFSLWHCWCTYIFEIWTNKFSLLKIFM